VADSLTGQGMVTRMAGDLDVARAHLHEALEMMAQAGDKMSISMVLTGLALVANDDGLPERAARLLGATARIRDELGAQIPPELIGHWGDPAEQARSALGEEAYRGARAEGYALSSEEAVSYALSEDERIPGGRGGTT
jgi:hypothetical protein